MENKNLYQKLHEIQSKIVGLGKDGKSFGYAYVTGSKVLGEIKPLMNEYGLMLKQEILSIDNERQDYATKNGSKSEILSKVMMRFTWIDVATGDKDENLFGANGQNDWDKGVGSALTYAERYFLLKYFHIATDEDDIDNDDRKLTPKELKQAEAEKLKEEQENSKLEALKQEQERNDARLKAFLTVEGLGTFYKGLSVPEKNRTKQLVGELKIKLENQIKSE